MPDDKYLVYPPEEFGCIPVRSELKVLPADNPADRVIGFSMHESIGVAAYNPRGLTRLFVFKYNCEECSMGWNDEAHVHDESECVTTRVHES